MERDTRDPLKGLANLSKKLTNLLGNWGDIPKSNLELRKLPKVTKKDITREFNPLPLGFRELYGIFAILIILIPEWIAGWWIEFLNQASDNKLPARTTAWQRKPELQLATMNIRELRKLARELRVNSYSNESRDRLCQRLLKRMSRES